MAKQTNEETNKDEETVNENTENQQIQPEEEEKNDVPVSDSGEHAQDQAEDKAAEENEADRPDTELLEKRINELTAEADSLKKARDDLNSRWLRAQADFENYRKRTNKEKADARKYRAQDLASDMLDILDNFKRALDVETASEDGAALKKGMVMVLNKLESALKKEGVEEIDSLGKPFDPNFHQAVMQEESKEHESGTVIQVLQAGYTLNGRVIRPAMVKVSA